MRRQLVAVSLAWLVLVPLQVVASRAQKPRQASLSLRVSPQISFSPARVVVTGELKDVDEASDTFYCPGLEWDWGDGTMSESAFDCEPFEAGHSEIKKRFVAEHTFQQAGRFRVQLRLKRQKKTFLSGNVTVQVKPGARDGFGD